MMTCQELAGCIERLQPLAQPRDVARLCLLLANTAPNLEVLENEDRLTELWRDTGLRLQLATDQHAAMTEELESLAQCDPGQLTAEQVWALVRAIKVQSQILQLYVGQPPLEI